MTTKKQHILILGAGHDQLSPIKKAISKGYKVTVVDKNPESIGKTFATNFYEISNRDTETINKLIKDLEINGNPITGIFLMGADIPQIAAELCIRNCLPSISLESAKIAQNKILMKNAFLDSNIPTPDFHIISNIKELQKLIIKYGKVVIKPSDNSGSRGVSLLTTKTSQDILISSYNDANENSKEKQVLLEEFIDGPQLSTESLILNGKASTYGYADRNYELLKTYAPNIVENGGIQPSEKYIHKFEDVNNLIELCAKSLGITNGIIKGDIVFYDNKPMVIEVAARLSGGDFAETLIPESCGFDFIDNALEISLGNYEIELPTPVYKEYVANRYFIPEKGELVDIVIDDEIYKESWLLKLDIRMKIGEKSVGANSNIQRAGVFIVKAKSIEKINKRINKVYNAVKFIYRSI